MNKLRAMMKSVFGGNEYIGSTYSKQRNKRLRSGIFVVKKLYSAYYYVSYSKLNATVSYSSRNLAATLSHAYKHRSMYVLLQ